MIYVLLLILGFGVAIPVHEAGHALTARYYGFEPRFVKDRLWIIPLLGIQTNDSWKSRRERFLMAASGPMASFLFMINLLAISRSPYMIAFASGGLDLIFLQCIPMFGITDGSNMLKALRTSNR